MKKTVVVRTFAHTETWKTQENRHRQEQEFANTLASGQR